jgi:hypothetical protein
MPISDLFPTGLRALFNPDQLQTDSVNVTAPQQPQNDTISQLTKVLLDRLNAPDPSVDRLNQLYAQFPQRTQPSFLRRLGGAVVGMGYGPEEANKFVERPYTNAVADWLTKDKAAQNIADLDIKNQRNDMSNAIRGIQADVANRAEQNKNVVANTKLAQDLEKAQMQNVIATQRANALDAQVKNQATNTQLVHEAAMARIAALQSEAAMRDLQHSQNLAETTRLHNAEIDKYRAQIDQLEHPEKYAQAKADAAALQPTASTRTMMEGAKMLLPHVDEVDKMAQDLNKRGLFGPVMSRIRDIAAKVGTTGDSGADPDKTNQLYNNFATALSKDPYINQTNDSVVGQFVTTLGLLASGAGRVHGGARGGGSIQMINYMKSLLSSDSTYDMFKGRLNALSSTLKGYAAGPKASEPSGLDKDINDIINQLSGKK